MPIPSPVLTAEALKTAIIVSFAIGSRTLSGICHCSSPGSRRNHAVSVQVSGSGDNSSNTRVEDQGKESTPFPRQLTLELKLMHLSLLEKLEERVQINEDSLAAVKHWQTEYEVQHNY